MCCRRQNQGKESAAGGTTRHARVHLNLRHMPDGFLEVLSWPTQAVGGSWPETLHCCNVCWQAQPTPDRCSLSCLSCRALCSSKLRDPACHVSWPSFCADPWSAAEELHDRGCIKRSKSYLYFHMEDQYHCMKTAEGGWAVDFIGRVDEPNEDWSEVSSTAHCAAVCLGPPFQQWSVSRCTVMFLMCLG